MNIWTTEEEAHRLKARFEKINRAKFAREQNLRGGQAMIYQHINGLRPISMEAALIYAKGLGVTLAEISPRLAQELNSAVKQVNANTSTGASGSFSAHTVGKVGVANDATPYLIEVRRVKLQLSAKIAGFIADQSADDDHPLAFRTSWFEKITTPLKN